MRRRKRRTRPRGTVFANGRTWWVKFSVRGQRVPATNTHIPTTEEGSREAAERFLDQALAKADLGIGSTDVGRTTFESMAELLRIHYRTNGLRSLDRAEQSIGQLAKRFAGLRAEEITDIAVKAYVGFRLATVVPGTERTIQRGTVRLELAALAKMMRLAGVPVPRFPELKPGDARPGFFEREDFERVVSGLPDYLKPVAWFGFFTGWRRGEILGLTWKSVDLKACVIRLEAAQSKNSEARTLPYREHRELVELMRAQHEARKDLQPWVFHNEGRPIGNFYDAWNSACKAACVPGKLFHDLRRSAVRNMERAGISRSAAMKITGHKTESVYRRYAIVNESDISEALGRLGGHNSDINRDFSGVSEKSQDVASEGNVRGGTRTRTSFEAGLSIRSPVGHSVTALR